MAVTEDAPPADDPDLSAADVAWDIDPLLQDRSIDDLLDESDAIAAELAGVRGTVADLDAERLAGFMHRFAALQELLGRAGSWSSLRFAVDTLDEANGALLQKLQERATEISNQLIFFELEWAEVPDERVEELLADERLGFCDHWLHSARRYRPHLLTEPEEKVLSDKRVTGASAWSRLFSELSSAITVELPDGDGATTTVALEQGLSRLSHPDREVRRRAAEAVTAGLAPGLRTRAFVFNTLLADKATDDRLRRYDSWISSRNLSNEASDASVQALVEAVVSRYETARRWYRLKARILGIDRLADYDRMASVAESEKTIAWSHARELVLDAYASFSPTLAGVAGRFFDEGWIDAPVRPGKRPGAFCAYTVPSHHPYLFLNWTAKQHDALTLAHELGHGLHAYLAREQGVFHQTTPLTLAETASVFGETVTFGRLLAETDDADDRLSLLAQSVEGAIATVFRQVAMNRFEHAVHTERREVGELSVERFGELWAATQTDLLGDAVEVTEGYRTWWSYIPHFIGTPGYVYAYAYGQLLAMSVYRRYEERGAEFVEQYLGLLAAGGSRPPEELTRLVDCDLEDPSFWDAGLDLVDERVEQAEAAAVAAGRVPD
ncbi:MAG: M3 family oligoendopeptidase [Acidimicrobiales bacterium]|jgi:oligoendopeptidase F|nr:M3 family oligoendopeptidase [Acidimicrobiales bacterium]